MTVLDQARSWLSQDPDEETRAELAMLISAAEKGSTGALDSLNDRFGSRLTFGTAGLRGEIAAGPNRMNRVVVAQAASGLAAYLNANAQDGQTPSVVIGYDGRKNSQIFATDTAELMAGAGIKAILLPRLLPTPLVAFAVRKLAASAGVMVTASHNPPQDNGYKVYLGGSDHGSQIVSPADAEIEAQIVRVANEVLIGSLPRSEQYEIAPESLIDDYIAATASLWTPPEKGNQKPRKPLRIVYTAMHGVGAETFSRVLAKAGFAEPILVKEQCEPDPAFSTVAFPNPEEPGALDLAYRTARAHDADLIVAHDPDADRLAIAIPDPKNLEGYRRLTGNEVGALLGWRAAELASATEEKMGALACSLVSSPALASVATEYGLRFEETLTGFKWVSRVPHLIFGYEEALGYLVNPETVRDKDGISAAVAFLTLAENLAAEGVSVAMQLERFSDRFGYFASWQTSLRVTDLTIISQTMENVRLNPPREIAGIAVDKFEDLATGSYGFPASDILRIWLSDGSRIMIRPSGTEPKLKIYLDVFTADGSFAERERAAAERIRLLDLSVGKLVVAPKA